MNSAPAAANVADVQLVQDTVNVMRWPHSSVTEKYMAFVGDLVALAVSTEANNKAGRNSFFFILDNLVDESNASDKLN
jgi:hypothetical protein